MAIVKILQKINEGWNVGDKVELFGEVLNEYVKAGSVEVLVPDLEPVKEEPVKEEIKPEVPEVKVKKIKNYKGGVYGNQS